MLQYHQAQFYHLRNLRFQKYGWQISSPPKLSRLLSINNRNKSALWKIIMPSYVISIFTLLSLSKKSSIFFPINQVSQLCAPSLNFFNTRFSELVHKMLRHNDPLFPTTISILYQIFFNISAFFLEQLLFFQVSVKMQINYPHLG